VRGWVLLSRVRSSGKARGSCALPKLVHSPELPLRAR